MYLIRGYLMFRPRQEWATIWPSFLTSMSRLLDRSNLHTKFSSIIRKLISQSLTNLCHMHRKTFSYLVLNITLYLKTGSNLN
jgi:hypothetical protein